MSSYTVAIIVVLVLLLIAAVWHTAPRERSLYDRLGGVYAIAAVVDRFSDALLVNPTVGKASLNPYLADWSNNQAAARLPGLKFMRTLWLCSVAGGPFKYSPTRPGACPFSLENAHKDLQITPDQFDAVATELGLALDYYKVPQRERGEVLAAFGAHKGEVTTGYTVAHGGTPSVVRCG